MQAQLPEDPMPDRLGMIAKVIEEVRASRARGKIVEDAGVIDAHRELLPGLAEELKKLGRVQSAREAASGGDAASATSDDLAEKLIDRLHSTADANWTSQTTVTSADLREGPGSRIGPYKLLQLIGEGGFGSVFMAEQLQPVTRKVAVKIIKMGMDTRAVIARFEAERQALAIMDHANIARVLDAGTTETGRPYFVMELVKGEQISTYADRNRLSIRERLELFGQVCHAVQHAHQKGVIHRDIKPGNVLVSTQDGRPFAKVIDFGIAKAMSVRLTEKTLFTEFHQLIGTPQYMSPEQAEGSLDVDTRADIYSLGVMLYELVTGTTPFDARALRSAAYDEMRRIIREVDPPKPSNRLSQSMETLPSVAANRNVEPKKLNGIVRGELDWIVMKALSKDRARRYESANEFAADILRYVMGEPVVAAPPTLSYRFRTFVRRHKVSVTVTAAIFVLLASGIWVSGWQAIRARKAEQTVSAQLTVVQQQTREAQRQRDAAVDANVRADAEHSKANRFFDDLCTHKGISLQEAGDEGAALLWYVQSLKLESGDKEREHEERMRINSILNSWMKEVDIDPHAAGLPDTDQNRFHKDHAIAWEGNKVQVLDKVTGKSVARTLICSDAIDCAELSPDGTAVFTACADGTGTIWDTAKGKPRGGQIQLGKRQRFVQFLLDGNYAITQSLELDETRVWDVKTGAPIGETIPLSWYISCSPDNKLMVIAGKDRVIVVQISTGLQVSRISCEGSVSRVDFVDQSRFVTFENRVGKQVCQLWEAATGRCVFSAADTKSGRKDFNWIGTSPDGKVITTIADEKEFQRWDAGTLRPLSDAVLLNDRLSYAGTTQNSHWIIAQGPRPDKPDHYVVLDAKDGRQILPALSGKENEPGIAKLIESEDGKFISTIRDDNVVQVWDAETLKALSPPIIADSSSEETVSEICVSFDGGRLMTETSDSIRFWETKTGKTISSVTKLAGQLRNEVMSADGSTIAGIVDLNSGPEVLVIDTDTAELVAPPLRQADYWPLSLSKDGSHLSIGGMKQDGIDVMRIFETPSNPQLSISYGTDGPAAVSFSDDGKTIVPRIYWHRSWDAQTGQAVAPPASAAKTYDTSGFSHCQASSDGRYDVVNTGNSDVYSLIDAITGKVIIPELTRIPIERYYLDGKVIRDWCVFSTDCTKCAMALCGADGKPQGIVVWDIDSKRRSAIGIRSDNFSEFNPLCFNPDGSQVLTEVGSVWDLDTAKHVKASGEQADLRIDLSQIRANGDKWPVVAEFDPMDQFLLAGNDRARVWRLKTGEPVTPWIEHKGHECRAAAFSQDGNFFAISFDDGMTQVWSVATALPVTPWLRAGATGSSVCFSGDGSKLLTGSDKGDIRVWNIQACAIPPAQLQSFAELKTGRRLDEVGSAVLLSAAEMSQRLTSLKTDRRDLFLPSPEAPDQNGLGVRYREAVERRAAAATSDAQRRAVAIEFTGAAETELESSFDDCAVLLAQTATRLDPTNLAAEDKLATAYLYADRPGEAIAIYEKFKGGHYDDGGKDVVMGHEFFDDIDNIRSIDQDHADVTDRIESMLGPTTRPVRATSAPSR